MTRRAPHLLLAGGGTGGHLYPALAIAQALCAQAPHWQVSFVGTARGLEARIVPQTGFALHLLPVMPLRGRTPKQTLQGLFALPRAGVAALQLLHRLAPTLVIGVGGYAAGPAVLAAVATGRPAWLIEANAAAGMTNRVLARVVDRLLLGMPNQRLSGSARAQVVGYPVRDSLAALGEQPLFVPHAFDAQTPLHILVMGGSQGARAINRVLPALHLGLRQAKVAVRIVHQTGPKELTATRAAYRMAGVDDSGVVGYIEAMDQALQQAQLVICRAGASTLAELGAVGRAALLVPYPHAADDHQTHNARLWADAGAAELIAEPQLSAADLVSRIVALARSPALLEQRATAAKGLGRPHATRDIVAQICALGADAGATRRDV